MDTIKLKKIRFIGLIFIFLYYGCGYTTVRTVPIDESLRYQTDSFNKINLNTALLINDDLKNSFLDAQYMDAVERIPLGDHLEYNSIKLIKTIFEKVDIIYGNEVDDKQKYDLIIIPKLVGKSRTVGWEQTASADLRWEVTDKNGNLIFIDTIYSTVNAELHFLQEAKIRTDLTYPLFKDLYTKSFNSLVHSPEILRLTN